MGSKRLSLGEQLILAASGGLFLFSFVHGWSSHALATSSEGPVEVVTTTAWGYYGFAGNLALLVASSAAALIALKGLGVDLDVPRRDVTYLVLTVGAAGLLFVALVAGPHRQLPAGKTGYRVTRGPVPYAALALGVAAVYGARLHRLQTTIEGRRLRRPSKLPAVKTVDEGQT